jgi:hypothetical protein
MGLRADLDNVEKKTTLHYQESNPGLPAHSLSLYRLSCPDFYVYINIADIGKYST